MSSTHRSKNSMEKGVLGLDDNEIQEELLNSDLKALGINEEDLSNMAIEEKQNLLTALKQSANPNHQEETNSRQNKKVSVNNHELQNSSSNQTNQTTVDKNEIEIAVDSPEEYPSLPPPASVNYVKRCNQQKQQQQKRLPPKKPNSASHFSACTVNHESGDEDDEDDEDSGDEYISDDEPRFTVPGYIDDNGIKLNDRARKAPLVRSVQYYTVPGQTSKNAIRAMLKHYNAWYKAWSFIDKCNNVKSTSTNESNKVSKEVVINDDSSSPMLIQENNYLIKNEISNSDENTLRKSSSPDIEEVEVTEVKPADSSRSLSNVNPFSNSKRNNQARGEPRGQNSPTPSCSSSSAIALGFKEKCDPEAGQWTTPRSKDFQDRSYDGKSQRSNKSAKKKDVQFAQKDFQKQEKKVQCPICQLNFSQSKVESHAAVCEGFPPETRSISPTSSPKLEESNSKGDSVSSDVVELTECNSDSKVMNKKRGN